MAKLGRPTQAVHDSSSLTVTAPADCSPSCTLALATLFYGFFPDHFILSNITTKLQFVLGRISQAAAIAGRDPATILLLAVSKTFPAEAVQAAMAAGQSAFGENYVQEGVAKVLAIREWLAQREAVAPATPIDGTTVPHACGVTSPSFRSGPLLDFDQRHHEFASASSQSAATAAPIDGTTVSHAYGVTSPSSRSGPLLCPPAWHFIGPIQSNKSRLIAEHFDWVHTVDRFKIAERLSAQRPANLPPLQVCVQVNISGEASKSGVTPAATLALAQAVAALPNLQLRGLMAIPEPAITLEEQHQPFAALRALLNQLNTDAVLLDHLARHGQSVLDTLSMGMSADLEAAVMEGATIVRVGSAIFGERNYAAGV